MSYAYDMLFITLSILSLTLVGVAPDVNALITRLSADEPSHLSHPVANGMSKARMPFLLEHSWCESILSSQSSNGEGKLCV